MINANRFLVVGAFLAVFVGGCASDTDDSEATATNESEQGLSLGAQKEGTCEINNRQGSRYVIDGGNWFVCHVGDDYRVTNRSGKDQCAKVNVDGMVDPGWQLVPKGAARTFSADGLFGGGVQGLYVSTNLGKCS